MSNLVNDVSYFGFTILLKYEKKKKGDDTFLRKKKQKRNRKSFHMIFVDSKFTAFPVKLKLQEKSFE